MQCVVNRKKTEEATCGLPNGAQSRDNFYSRFPYNSWRSKHLRSTGANREIQLTFLLLFLVVIGPAICTPIVVWLLVRSPKFDDRKKIRGLRESHLHTPESYRRTDAVGDSLELPKVARH